MRRLTRPLRWVGRKLRQAWHDACNPPDEDYPSPTGWG